MNMMKAIVLKATENAVMQEIPIPVCKNGEVLIRTKAATICTSDMLDLHGALFAEALPIVMGHEGAGVVEAVGEGVDEALIGKEVAVHPVMPCYECNSCKRGFSHLCDDMEHLCMNRDGVFAEYFITRPDCIRIKPQGMSFAAASLMEPVCVCLEAISRASVKEGGRVLIIGDGPFGVMTSKLCMSKKPKQIIHTGSYDFRLEQVVSPITHTIREKRTDVLKQKIMELTDGEGIDSVILCVSNPIAVDLAIEVLRARGTLCIFSALEGKTPVDLFRLQIKELNITGSCNDENYMDEAIRLLQDSKLGLGKVVTHELPFEKWEDAFNMVEKERGSCLKVSLVM